MEFSIYDIFACIAFVGMVFNTWDVVCLRRRALKLEDKNTYYDSIFEQVVQHYNLKGEK